MFHSAPPRVSIGCGLLRACLRVACSRSAVCCCCSGWCDKDLTSPHLVRALLWQSGNEVIRRNGYYHEMYVVALIACLQSVVAAPNYQHGKLTLRVPALSETVKAIIIIILISQLPEAHWTATINNKITERKQEAQQMLTNLRDAFRGHSRSRNSTISYVRYSFLLCNSNIVFKTRRFSDIRLQKCRDLESRSEVTQGHWKWYHSIVYGFLLVFLSNFVPKTHRYWDIRLKNAVTLKTGLGPIKVIGICHHSVKRVRLPVDVL